MCTWVSASGNRGAACCCGDCGGGGQSRPGRGGTVLSPRVPASPALGLALPCGVPFCPCCGRGWAAGASAELRSPGFSSAQVTWDFSFDSINAGAPLVSGHALQTGASVVTAALSQVQSCTCNDLQAGDASGHFRHSRRHQPLVEVDKRVLGQPRPVEAVPEVFLQQALQHEASMVMIAAMSGCWRPVLWVI
jgi:hypothetical protein